MGQNSSSEDTKSVDNHPGDNVDARESNESETPPGPVETKDTNANMNSTNGDNIRESVHAKDAVSASTTDTGVNSIPSTPSMRNSTAETVQMKPSTSSRRLSEQSDATEMLSPQLNYFHQRPTPQQKATSLRPIDAVLESSRLDVFLGTWNLKGLRAPDSINDFLFPPDIGYHDVYVIGTQECGDPLAEALSPAALGAKRQWEAILLKELGEDFTLIRSQALYWIHSVAFTRCDLLPYISFVQSDYCATGIGNVVGNKGATVISFCIGKTAMLFNTCHLEAHAKNVEIRNAQFKRINNEIHMMNVGPSGAPVSEQASIPLFKRFDRVFWMGDLNYRINGTRRMIDVLLKQAMYEVMIANDQLLREQKNGNAFHGFLEGPLVFLPTYKFDVGTHTYDSSRKGRVPSWTDRILFYTPPEKKKRWWKRMPSIVHLSSHKQNPKDLLEKKKHSIAVRKQSMGFLFEKRHQSEMPLASKHTDTIVVSEDEQVLHGLSVKKTLRAQKSMISINQNLANMDMSKMDKRWAKAFDPAREKSDYAFDRRALEHTLVSDKTDSPNRENRSKSVHFPSMTGKQEPRIGRPPVVQNTIESPGEARREVGHHGSVPLVVVGSLDKELDGENHTNKGVVSEWKGKEEDKGVVEENGQNISLGIRKLQIPNKVYDSDSDSDDESKSSFSRSLLSARHLPRPTLDQFNTGLHQTGFGEEEEKKRLLISSHGPNKASLKRCKSYDVRSHSRKEPEPDPKTIPIPVEAWQKEKEDSEKEKKMGTSSSGGILEVSDNTATATDEPHQSTPIELRVYDSIGWITCSDHRPVYASFSVEFEWEEEEGSDENDQSSACLIL